MPMKWPGSSFFSGKSEKRPEVIPTAGLVTGPLARFIPPDDLLTAMQKWECVLVAGEQLSVTSAVLPWSKFLRSLTDWLSEMGALTDLVANHIRACAVKEDIDTSWKLLLPGMQGREAAVLEYARSAYVRPAPLTKIHETLAKLNFSGVITPNLDSMLERAFAHRSPRCLGPTETGLFDGGFCALKLRGVWERPETINLDPQTAADSNRGNESYRTFVEATHAVHRLLFVGISPAETGRILNGLNWTRQPTQHMYVLAAIAADDKTVRKAWDHLQGTYRFALLTYAAGDSATVCQFLEKLLPPVKPDEDPEEEVIASVDSPTSGA
jgi:hypothetical protein